MLSHKWLCLYPIWHLKINLETSIWLMLSCNQLNWHHQFYLAIWEKNICGNYFLSIIQDNQGNWLKLQLSSKVPKGNTKKLKSHVCHRACSDVELPSRQWLKSTGSWARQSIGNHWTMSCQALERATQASGGVTILGCAKKCVDVEDMV